MDHIASTSGINSLSSSAPLKHEDSRAVSICSSCQDSRFQGREVSLVQRRSEHQALPEGPAQCPVCKKAVGPRSASPANPANEISKPPKNRCRDLRLALSMDDGKSATKVQDLMDEGVILPLKERSRALKEALGVDDNGSFFRFKKTLARRILPQTFSLATGMYPVMPRHAPALWQMDVSLSPKELLRALTVLQRSIDSDGGKASGQRRLIQEDHIKLLVQIAETMPADKLSRIMLSSFKTEGEVGIGYIKLLLGMASNPLTHRLLDAVCDNLNPEQKS
ncbi:hypothetical protein, partial [Endozoicomonas sp. YOMI1]|uniref:hypothetical protein n=1 Tax=Endozoicomonas sp. YOMI1 TaxID=2828739 RepID=UPI0021488A20